MLNAADAEGLDNFLSRQADAMGGAILSFGTVIDGWRVAGLLGRVGSGEVYRVVRGIMVLGVKRNFCIYCAGNLSVKKKRLI